MKPPTVLDVYAARRRLDPIVPPTPLRESAWLSDVLGGPASLKLESFNLTSSFKVRGAFNALLRLIEAEGHRPAPPTVVTASAGNHGRAVAAAAERLGVRAVVYTPSTAPRAKTSAIRRHGAELHDEAADYDTAVALARARADHLGVPYLSPYSHPDVIAGAGVIGLEIVEACPDVATVVVPLGGGGLASGIGLALRAAAPGVRIIGVEVEASTPFTTGLAAGQITAIEPGPTLADGLAGNLEPDAITFPLVARLVDEVVRVSEKSLREAMRALAAHEQLLAEGAAAVAVAALLDGLPGPTAWPAVALVTGANIDLDTLAEVIGSPHAAGRS